MDFIRATIKGLFYDFPLDTAGDMVYGIGDAKLINRLAEILKWKEQFFTMSEIKILMDVVDKNWMRYDMVGSDFPEGKMNRIFLPLNQFSKDVIDDSGNEPKVKFENLLRWHELTMYVGEDLLVTAYLAERDMYCGRDRNDFVWNDVLRHDNHQLNHILDEGLCDVHAHLGATADVFGINWISLMNNPNKNRLIDDPYQEFDIHLHDNVKTMPLRLWGWLAAAIRVQLYNLTINERFDEKGLLNLFDDYKNERYNVIDAYNEINGHREIAYKMSDGKCLDYAITDEHIAELTHEKLLSPYMIHFGERRLIYKFFYLYFCRNFRAISAVPWMYLYLLIKVKYRREFIETNPLSGLSNFQKYERRKRLFSDDNDLVQKYAIQTSISNNANNFLEARVGASVVDNIRFKKTMQMLDDNPTLGAFDSIFLNSCYLTKEYNSNLSFVIHFFKINDSSREKKGVPRYGYIRKRIEEDMKTILSTTHNNRLAKVKGLPLLTGIDAAGNELNCRPEVFAPYYRQAKAAGVNFFTYHAGEDFYDLVDGMRTIDELMLFMEYSHGCRIGHALALGVDAYKYYTKRHNNVIIPQQVLLDNMVWMVHKARMVNHTLQPSTTEFCQRTIHRLLIKIGYGNSVDEYSYWQSMLLRGDKPSYMRDENSVNNTMAEMTAFCKRKECVEARRNNLAKKLHQQYETDETIKIEGEKPDVCQVPKTFYKDVMVLQDALLCDIEHNGICIECNPSSNLQIGPFDKYDELPIQRFMTVKDEGKGHSVQISINTDDRGIFATSLQNEYSLIAASMHKQLDVQQRPKYSADEINRYIKRIIGHSKNMRF